MRPPSPPRPAPGRSAPAQRRAPDDASATQRPATTPEPGPGGAEAHSTKPRSSGARKPASAATSARRPSAANPRNPPKSPADPPGGVLVQPSRAGEQPQPPGPGAEARAAASVPERSGRPTPRSWAGVALARISHAPGVVSTRLSERLSERRAARRRLALRRLAIIGGLAAVVALLGYVVLASGLLALRSEYVRVATTGPTVDAALVAEALEPAVGTPLARLSMGALEHSVERVPGVRSASVRRAWPAGLAVDVVARVPVAAVPGAGQLMLLDVDGVQVGDPVAAAPDGLPVVVVSPGSRGAESLNAVLSVLGDLPPELLAEIREASAASADTVRLRLSDGSRVEWGSSELSALKLRVLEVLRQRPAWVYDVSAPSRPVTR